MSLEILGIGTAVPDHKIDQADAAEQVAHACCGTAEQQRLVKVLYRRTGVRTRHSVLLESNTNGAPAEQSFYRPELMPLGPTTGDRMRAYEKHAAELALRASRQAVEEAGVDGSQVTHLISVSCSGFSAPGVDVTLLQGLALSSDTARTHIGFMGCHAALNAVRVADAFARADTRATILLCAVELCSLHHQFDWQPEQMVANALFADGAAAMVVKNAPASRGWKVVAQRSTVLAESADVMSWRIGDHGFQMTLSPRLPRLIEQSLRPWLQSWLRELGHSIENIGSWGIHPGGPRILDACVKSIDLPGASLIDSRQVLADYGNMSSPTLLFILERMMRRDRPRPCVLLAFGPGITIEAALLE
jgi:predicted naringenin-chalcone synthase